MEGDAFGDGVEAGKGEKTMIGGVISRGAVALVAAAILGAVSPTVAADRYPNAAVDKRVHSASSPAMVERSPCPRRLNRSALDLLLSGVSGLSG